MGAAERRARRAAVLRPAKPCDQSRRRRCCSFAFYRLRDDPIVPVICPTCQTVFAGSRMPATARLLCMGLFSIFWVREPRWPCGWPARPELAAAPSDFRGTRREHQLGAVAAREREAVSGIGVIARSESNEAGLSHSGAMRSIEPQMRNCASGNLEIPGLVLSDHPGMTEAVIASLPRAMTASGSKCYFSADFCLPPSASSPTVRPGKPAASK